MGILNLLIYFFLISVTSPKKLGNKNPKLLVRDGNLVFLAARDKKIQFETMSAGVSINGVDILTTLNKVYNTSRFVNDYQNRFSTYVDRLEWVEQRILSTPTANSSTLSPSSPLAVRRLRRSIIVLAKKVNDIETAMLQNNCAENPCQNGGTCQNMYKNYACHCADGWEGRNCLQDVNECARFVGTDLGCQNGATCINKPGTYECLCPPGFVGIHCTRRKADCSTGGEELCGHGTCVQQNTQTGYKCICDQGWTTDGTSQACIADVNECNSNHPSCSTDPKVPCVNVPGSYYCGACPTGYSGNGYHCSDINECETNNGGCSTNPMVTCINTQGSRICGLCPPGYEGDGVSCLFRGVCNVNNGGCHHLAQCRDNSKISSTYVECICPTGYVGNGIGPNGCTLSSSPFNPCASNPCLYGDCLVNNITGNYACNCRKNYRGRNCDTLKTDTCANNPCRNGGTCQNVMSVAFRCICRSGFSGMTCEKESQGCGGRLSGTSGVLSYPTGDFATYGNRVSCAWTIETNSTKILNITFTKFDIEASTGCRSDWLQIHDGPNSASHSLGRFCGTTPPLGGKIVSTHNIIYFWFRSDAGNAKTGFKLTWNATTPACGRSIIASSHGRIESPGSPANYPPNRDCYWSIVAPIGKRLLFHFYSLNIGNNADCSKDFIEFHSLYRLSSNQPYAKFCNTSDPSPFYSPSDNTIIYFHSAKDSSYPGFQVTFSVVEGIPGCGGVYTADEGQIQSALQPSTCEYKIQHGYNGKTKITFLNLNISQSPGCQDEYVELREGPNIDSPLMGRYCGSILPGVYISNSQLTIISSISSDSSKWKLEYKKICGTKFFNNTGSFVSPARTYKIDCIYEIEQPVGYAITLIIKVTQTHRFFFRPCVSGYIEIRDGDHEDATLIKKICDPGSETITSTHNHLWIRYFAPSVISLKFEATYTSTDVGCGGILRDKTGNIASPTNSDGLYYPPSLKCSWVIIAPPKNVIKLTWVTFNLEVSYDCVYDRIEVYDNNTDLGMGGLIGKYCGATLPPTLMSSSNIMTVTFKSDVTVHKEGFLATYLYLPESKVCGGDYFTPAGVIKSPGYPGEYSPNKDCTWTITVPSGQQIQLNVIDFHLENYSNCRYDWLEIRNGGTSHSPVIGKYCGDTITKRISSHTNKLYLHFVSDPNRQETGFKITWSSTSTGCGGPLTSPSGSIISPNYPEPYSRNTECTWKITVSSGSKIRVVFSDIDLESAAQCKLKYIPDYVQLFDGPTINSKSLGKFCSMENSLVISSTHEVLVQFRSDVAFQGRGFQLFYSTICNRTLTGFRGIIESPNFPGDYPEGMHCTWHIIVSDKNKINITFSHFELEGQYNNSCVSDYVELKYLEPSGDYEEERTYGTQGKYCGSNNPGQITVDSDHAEIHFVSDQTGAGMGFRLEWQIFGCGGRLTHNTGTIQSPNYPKAYPPSVKCEWLIEVDFGNSIEIQFHEIDVEKENCDYDWIQVYNGPDNSSNLLLKACYQIKPIVLFSTGNQMFIEFQADYSYQGRGFKANYTTMKAKCGGRFVAQNGVISSPNYPQNYNNNDTCYWFIEVDDTHAIELKFEDVDLPGLCNSTYIKVYDGPTEAYPVLSKICNTAPNETIKSTFNELYIEFRASNSHYTTKGFRATYKTACGSRMTTQGSGNIQISRHEMVDYEKCTWTIVSTDLSKHVTLTISQMDMEVYNCDDNKPIKIYGGETTEAPLLKTFCGDKVPLPIVSDGSAMTIQIDYTMNFFATYSVLDSHCGGTFTSVKGFFASPGYSKTYPSNMECEWTISVAPGNHVTLSFIEFDILESDKCNTDFLEIRKNNVSGQLLGVYCGKNKPDNLTHEGSLWMMFKSSELDGGANVAVKGFYGEFEHNQDNELSGSQGIIASPMYPQNYHTYGSFSWKITVAPRKVILLTFKEFYFEGSTDECYSAIFTVYDGVDSTAPTLQSICGMDLPDPIKSSTNILFIQVEYNYIRMGSRFLVEWLEIGNKPSPVLPSENQEKECGTSEVVDINSNGSYLIKSPGYPDGYKPNLNCEWLFSTIPMNHLFVQFTDVNLMNFLPFRNIYSCTDDYVGIYQKHAENNDWELVNKLCNMNDKPARYHTTNLLKVQFISNRFFNGTGFSAYVEQSCGGSMTDPTGSIIFNKSIISGYNCQWNVTVRSGKTIRVTFEEMNIAHDASKGCDNYIMLRNGKYPDSPILGVGKYCGTDIPEPLETTGNHLYIKYRGSSKIKGFKLKYQEESVKCGGEILLTTEDNSTEISSPNFPNIPLPHTECTWLIRAPSEELLRIDFEERFDLTHQKQCNIEYVEVRDGGTELSPLIGRYCQDVPQTQFSSGNLLFVKFFTNTEDPRNGFKAQISLGYCGGTIRGMRGEIRSPTRQTNDNRRNCTWHIFGPIDRYLNIRFTDVKIVDIPANSSRITILEKNQIFDNVTILAEYSGTVLPPVLTTSGNTAIVNYVGTNKDSFHMNFNISQSECGGSLNIESGVIMSPGYPVMNHMNRYCQWRLEVPEGRRITVDFVDFDLDESITNIQAVAVLDGSIPFKIPLAYLRPGAPKQVIESSSNKMLIIFWSNRASLHRGFKATFSSNKPTICSSNFNSDSGVLTQPVSRNSTYWCHWKHQNRNLLLNQTFALTITLKANSNRKLLSMNCTYSSWSVTVMNQNGKQILASLCKPTVENFKVQSPYPVTEVTALAKNQMNFTISYNTYNCGGIVKEQQGFLSSPNYPNKPSQSVECAWLIKVDNDQTVNLTMLSMDLGSDCARSYIRVFNGESPSHPEIGQYCKTDKPGVIISQSNALWIEYAFESGTTGTGFKLQYEAMSEGCGGIYHDKNRIIQTPNYGKSYPNNAECLWEIRASPGYSIGLKFIERFLIEDSDKCINDYLEVWDWQYDKWVSIAKICGRNIPTNIQSTGDKLKVLFRSNEKITASGFKAKWKWLCGGNFEATKIPRTIVSPGYPIVYTPRLNCVYNITTKAEVLSITFDDFELEKGAANCMYDNVTISGKYYFTYSPLQTTYCGTVKPAPLRVRGNAIITFKTDKWVNRKGFKFTYSDESCGGDINQSTIIQAPSITYRRDYRFYFPRVKCVWKITAPPKQIAILRVLSLSLPALCLDQGVEVFNGLNDNRANRLASLCGNITDSNQPIHADSGNMLVRLNTNPFAYKGFRAQVYFSHGPAEGCGGTINLTETKTIQPPDLENLDCSWTIIAPKDQQIQIHFTEVNIPSACNKNTSAYFCTCSFVEVRDGGGSFSELIEKLCSTSNNSPEYRKFNTSSNYAHIRLVLEGRQSNTFRAVLMPVLSQCGITGLSATDQVQTLTSPNYPNKYPPGVKCTWVITTQNQMAKIELHFIDFNLVWNTSTFIDQNSCDDDRVEIMEDPNKQIITEGFGPEAVYQSNRRPVFLSNNNVPGLHTFCGTEESPFDYYSIGRSLSLTFKSHTTMQQGRGFKIEYRVAGCNRNYTSLQGRLLSSNGKSDCIITITVPENRTISLYFQRLMISYSRNCSSSAFEVRDNGPNGALLIRSCGFRIPDPIFSFTNKLYIHTFSKNMSPFFLSYDVGYTSTDAGRGCGGKLYNYKGWVSSPLYPNEFRNSTECTWDIRVPIGLSATLKFVNLELQGSCYQTYISVTTYTLGTPTTHKFCKDDRPAILRSNSKIEIKYQSSVHNGGRGWLATFQGISDDITVVN